MLRAAKVAVQKTFPKMYSRWIEWNREPLEDRVRGILASDVVPQTYSEEVFDRLQAQAKRVWPPYAPNYFSRWNVCAIRIAQVLQLPGLFLRENLRVLEAACGNGLSGPLFASFGHSVVLHDREDWRDERAKSIDFVAGDLCKPLPIEEQSFDLVCCWDSFEHIEDIDAVFSEFVRLCKKGGYIYLDFGPLWCSPTGLHALNFNIPYAQFMFSSEIIEAKILQFPNVGGEVVQEDGAWAIKNRHMDLMNKVRLADFKAIWKNSGCEIVSLSETKETKHLHVIADYSKAFTGRSLTFDDVITDRLTVLLKTPS